MTGRHPSARSQAGHYRELAEWTADSWTHDILLQMARELEEEEAGDAPPVAAAPAVPRALS